MSRDALVSYDGIFYAVAVAIWESVSSSSGLGLRSAEVETPSPQACSMPATAPGGGHRIGGGCGSR